MLKKTVSGITAGLLIGIGGAAYLACESKVVGAFLFTIGLLSVCCYGVILYTGRIGYICGNHGKEALADLVFGLAGNGIGALLTGLAIRAALPAAAEKARSICEAKLALSVPGVLLRAAFCGILVYIAVNLFRDKKTPLGILIGIPAFILSGFEHSIADMFYLAAAGIFSWSGLWFILLVLAGNSIGAILFDRLLHFSK